MIADVFDHRADKIFAVGQFTALDIATQEVAENTAEIFVAGKRHEGAGIGQHADETGEQADVGKRVQLPLNAFLLIEKPPGAAKLDFAGDAAVLEIAGHGGKDVVIAGIEIVEDHLGQGVFAIELIQVGTEGRRLREVHDGIKAEIGAEGLQGAGVDVAESAEMQLFGPAGLCVEVAEIEHQVGGKFGVLFVRCGLSGACFIENSAGAGFATEICVTVDQAVIGETATCLMEVIVTFAQSVQEIREGADMDIGGGSETLDPGIEYGGEMNVQGAIGAKRRVDTRGQMGRGNLGVGLQIVGGVIGGAEGTHPELGENSLRGQFRGFQKLVGMLPNFRSRLFVEQFVDAKIALQFQVSPVVERIAEAVRDRGGPSEELVVGRSIAGTKGFSDAVGTHGTPFVVIALEPNLEEVAKPPIGGDVRRGEMRVEIKDGLTGGKSVIEMAGGGVLEQEILVDKGHIALPRSGR